MAQIIPSGSLNVPALGADDAYVQIVAPPSFVTGTPTDVIGLVGTASWGPVNTPVHLGSGQDATNNFGPISAASLTDPYDLPTDLFLAFGQSQSQATIEGWAVRVSDGTDTKASVSLQGSDSSAAETITVSGTITADDTVTATVTSDDVSGSPVSVTYQVKTGDTLSSVAAGLAAAINANAAITSAGIAAIAADDVISVFVPTGKTATLSESTSTSATETLTVGTGSTTKNGLKISGIFTGTLGNSIQIKIENGTKTDTFTATILPPVGLPESYPNLPSTGFWAALATAINSGMSSVRGRSQVVQASDAVPAVGAPSTGTFTLTGGADGRSGVASDDLLGNADATPRTGLWALTDLQPPIGIAWIVGSTDLTIASSLLAFAQSSGASVLIPLPSGLSTDQAISTWQASGVADPAILPVKDFIRFFDSVNGLTRRVPATAVIGGRWATLGPEQSPGNKAVSLVVGTDRNDPIAGNIPYTTSEIAQLEATGILFIANPIPRGRVFGIRHGQSSSLDPVTKPAEYWRMTMYLARSAAGFLGQYVDELQSTQDDDPVRAAFRLQSNQFLKRLQGAGQIDRFLVTCQFTTNPSAKPGNGINTPASVAAHYLFGLWQVRYLSSIRFFVLSLQGGTTVVDVGGSLTQQQVNL